MTWVLSGAIDSRIEADAHDDYLALTIKLMSGWLDKFSLGLCLLDAGLIPSITFLFDHDRQKLVLSRSEKPSSLSVEDAKATLSLDLNDFELLRFFSLRAVRDGVPEVDHIDLELSGLRKGKTVRADVVIQYPST
jgi:hypothetical protein